MPEKNLREYIELLKRVRLRGMDGLNDGGLAGEIRSNESALKTISSEAAPMQGKQPAYPDISVSTKRLVEHGANFTVGTDGGLGYMFLHVKLWNHVYAGLTPAEGLRVFTLNGARVLRMEKDLGSIEPGKIADLVILNSNPLDDITRTADIFQVVKSGEGYDVNTLDVVWPTPRRFDAFPWAKATGTLPSEKR